MNGLWPSTKDRPARLEAIVQKFVSLQKPCYQSIWRCEMRCSNCGWPLDECNESQPVCPRCGGAGLGELEEIALMLEKSQAKAAALTEKGE